SPPATISTGTTTPTASSPQSSASPNSGNVPGIAGNGTFTEDPTTFLNGTAPQTIPLVVTNNCPETLWPAIISQRGLGPEVGGFELATFTSRVMCVSPDWQGRVWGRTNCSFNDDGTAPSVLGGVNGSGAACLTGDCAAQLDCKLSGRVPASLAEFNLAGGYMSRQTFYDISLVDGYNLPLGIVYIPAENTTWIPPNLTNLVCIASPGYLADPAATGLTYTNATYPMPYEPEKTNDMLLDWCPWELQAYPPASPGDAVFPYPEGGVQRPLFDPCLSACASTNLPQDCCTYYYHDPFICQPSTYSRIIKAICPDAYSYAYDDRTSTFIIPSGGGFEVVFCPVGRSTNILTTAGDQLRALSNNLTQDSDTFQQQLKNLEAARKRIYLKSHPAPETSRSAGRYTLVLLIPRCLVVTGVVALAIARTEIEFAEGCYLTIFAMFVSWWLRTWWF
ncbi:Osmotin, thaumatin-like protein, partial [Diplogelasinospora grovesii]